MRSADQPGGPGTGLVAAATGHRPQKLGGEFERVGPYSHWIYEQMDKFIREEKPERLITGMALGVDQIWATLAIAHNIPFTAAIPCRNQDKFWNDVLKEKYRRMLEHRLCTQHYVHDGPFTRWCMQKRNRWMVDNCGVLVAVWDGSKGGTGNCVRYAQQVEKRIHHIHPDGWRESV